VGSVLSQNSRREECLGRVLEGRGSQALLKSYQQFGEDGVHADGQRGKRTREK
jgi:hypothetical protein